MATHTHNGAATHGAHGAPPARVLVAIPVFNEARHIDKVIGAVLKHATDVLVVDDGSSDATPALLARHPVEVIRHARNRGYGRSLREAFSFACCGGYDWVITMDCDEQHEPAAIPRFIEAMREGHGHRWDIISGSRYRCECSASSAPPAERRAINRQITDELNARLGLHLTDAFCGFKAHRVSAMRDLELTDDGYAFPMQLWVQARAAGGGAGLRIRELPVDLIYNDLSRTFGNGLDDAVVRLAHYRRVMHDEIARCAARLPAGALEGMDTGCGRPAARLVA